MQWLGSSTTNLQGRDERDFASSSACEQMVTESTAIDGWVQELVMTNVADVVEVRVDSSVGTSDHSSMFPDAALE